MLFIDSATSNSVIATVDQKQSPKETNGLLHNDVQVTIQSSCKVQDVISISSRYCLFI